MDALTVVKIYKTGSRNSKYPVVEAPIPEDYSINFTNNYDNPFQNLVPAAVEGVVQLVTNGQTLQFKQKYYTYTGSSPLKIDLNLEFIATSSFDKEVKPMIAALMKMASPSAEGGMLGNLKTPESDGDISVEIGHQFHLSQCLLEGLTITNHKPLLVGGKPSKVIASVSVISKSLFIKENAESVYS